MNEHVAAGRQQVAADGETDTLGAGGNEGTFAVEFIHGGKKEHALMMIIIINQLLEMRAGMKFIDPAVASKIT